MPTLELDGDRGTVTEPTMIERVARIIDPSAWKPFRVSPEREFMAGALRQIYEKRQRASLKRARDAIVAMRDPTDAMKLVGAEFFEEGSTRSNAMAGGIVYSAMIEAALVDQLAERCIQPEPKGDFVALAAIALDYASRERALIRKG